MPCIKLKPYCLTSLSRCHSSIPMPRPAPNPADLVYFARKKQVPVDLQTLLQTGLGKNIHNINKNIVGTNREKVLMQVATFLHRELPVRLAHRAVELEANPVLKSSSHVRQVAKWYKDSFSDLRDAPHPMSVETEAEFAQTIARVYDRHSRTLMTMAKGAYELRVALGHDLEAFAQQEDVQGALDDFYLSRIGIRMLIGQYLALRDQDHAEDSDHKNFEDFEMIGLVKKSASPYEIAQAAISDAAYMCTRLHGDAPEVTIHGRTDLSFPYVPSHIHYMLIELLKNSMRATVEYHGVDNMPPIKIVIADGESNEDVCIKVSDEGGGIPRSNMNNIWSYLFTTADPNILRRMIEAEEEGNESVRDFATDSPLAGLGYGLPIARNYARYFGGDLTIMSMEGYGTDSYLYLNRLGTKVHVIS